ncbi:clasp N terminal-domain-containing protein [Coemansia spiralis]|nr:clasp N terminal-domain-containing protein [Coemansia spiralis]
MDYNKCESASDFEAKFKTLIAKLDVVEHEETWSQIDDALKSLISLVKAGATKFDSFVPTMKQAAKFINSAISSERTRLSGTALTLVEELARMMETRFHPLLDMLFQTAMKTCGRANKVFVTRGVNCLTTVITYSHAPEQTPHICRATSTDPNKTMRASAAKLLMATVSCCTVPELTPHLAIVEKAIADGVVDANPDARTTARQSYEIYIKRFSDRVEQFHAGLSSIAKKYLKIVDKASQTTNARPQAQFAAFRQRLPLRDRIAGQRPGAQQAPIASGGVAGRNGTSEASAEAKPVASAGPHRLKPVRPLARPVPTAVRKDIKAAIGPMTATAVATTATTAAGAATDVAVATVVALPAVPLKLDDNAPPALGTKCNSLENVLMSPHSNKSSLARLFGEDQSTTEQLAAPSDTNKTSPPDSARASASPTISGPVSRASSPGPKDDGALHSTADDKKAGEPEKTAAISATELDKNASSATTSADEAPANPTKDKEERTAAKRPVSRAQRAPGLSFSSLNGANSGRAVRGAQQRSTVASRLEEALRARPQSRQAADSSAERGPQRPTKNAAATGDSPRRMTLRSDTRTTSTKAPGYLRATASSAKRVAGTY